jgi:predicted hydrocarbon binding protein
MSALKLSNMPDYVGPLTELDRRIRETVGDEAADTIMMGLGDVKNSWKKDRVAHWVKAAMARMDETLDDEVKEEIMVACGHNCAARHGAPIRQAVKRREKHEGFYDFLDAMAAEPPKGMQVERDGDAVVFGYTPQTFGGGMRCYCSLVNGLPMDETMSETYCLCSRGFVEAYWEAVSGGRVDVELLESAVSGSDVCRFRVRFL